MCCPATMMGLHQVDTPCSRTDDLGCDKVRSSRVEMSHSFQILLKSVNYYFLMEYWSYEQYISHQILLLIFASWTGRHGDDHLFSTSMIKLVYNHTLVLRIYIMKMTNTIVFQKMPRRREKSFFLKNNKILGRWIPKPTNKK